LSESHKVSNVYWVAVVTKELNLCILFMFS